MDALNVPVWVRKIKENNQNMYENSKQKWLKLRKQSIKAWKTLKNPWNKTNKNILHLLTFLNQRRHSRPQMLYEHIRIVPRQVMRHLDSHIV